MEIRIKAELSIGYSTAKRTTVIEIDDAELEGMTEDEKEDYINEEVQNWAENYIETWWNVEE